MLWLAQIWTADAAMHSLLCDNVSRRRFAASLGLLRWRSTSRSNTCPYRCLSWVSFDVLFIFCDGWLYCTWGLFLRKTMFTSHFHCLFIHLSLLNKLCPQRKQNGPRPFGDSCQKLPHRRSLPFRGPGTAALVSSRKLFCSWFWPSQRATARHFHYTSSRANVFSICSMCRVSRGAK